MSRLESKIGVDIIKHLFKKTENNNFAAFDLFEGPC